MMSESCKLLCFAPFAGKFGVHHQLDLALGLGVRLRGGEVVALGCNQLYHECEVVMHSPATTRATDCAHCAIAGRHLLQNQAIPFYTLNDFVVPGDLEAVTSWSATQFTDGWRNAEYKGKPLGAWCLSSMLVAFQRSIDNVATPETYRFYQAQLRNAALTVIALERLLQSFMPTVAVVFNARFAVYRTAFEVLRAHGVRVIVHERGLSDNSFIFVENCTIIDSAPLFSLAEAWKDVALGVQELERARSYLANREAGKDQNLPAIVAYSSNEALVRRKLGVGSEDLVGVFTSTEAELAQTESLKIASVQLPLVAKCVDAMRELPNYTLVIRHHPNLAGDPLHPPEYAFISEIYQVLKDAPPNIRTIMPSEELSSYALLWNLQGAVCPFSTLGIEAPSRGNATLASERTAFSKAQVFRFGELEDLDVKRDLPALVQRSKAFDVEALRLCYRFVYMLIERFSVALQSVKIKDFYLPDISPNLVNDLMQGEDPALRRIVGGLVENRPLEPLPCDADRAVGTEHEDAFLAREVAAIREKKEAVYQASLHIPSFQAPVLWLSCKPRVSIYPDSFCERYRFIDKKDIESYHSSTALLERCEELALASDGDFVVLNDIGVSFDGHFVSSGVETLLETSPDKQMLLRGAWIGDVDGKLRSEYLSKRRPGIDEAYTCECFPRGISIPILLSLGFYRREFFLKVLSNVKAVSNDEERVRVLLSMWQTSDVLMRPGQAGLVLFSRPASD